MRDADQLHDSYDDMAQSPLADDQVELVRIVGESLATMDSIAKIPDVGYLIVPPPDPLPPALPPGSSCVDYAPRYISDDRVEGGDATVPLHSADLYNPGKGFDLRGKLGGEPVPNVYVHNAEHGTLANDERGLSFASDYFGKTPDSASRQQASSQSESFFPRVPRWRRRTPKAAGQRRWRRSLIRGFFRGSPPTPPSPYALLSP